jgi:hypothetical protein
MVALCVDADIESSRYSRHRPIRTTRHTTPDAVLGRLARFLSLRAVHPELNAAQSFRPIPVDLQTWLKGAHRSIDPDYLLAMYCSAAIADKREKAGPDHLGSDGDAWSICPAKT